jgi:predicted DNA-binding protein (UPF0251 family)
MQEVIRVPELDEARGTKYLYDSPLSTAKGVAKFLAYYHYFHSEALDDGNMDAVIIMADFNNALSKAALTEKQYEALYFVFYRGLNQRETSEEMKCSKQAIQQLIHSSTTKISEAYVVKIKQ